MKKAGFIGSFVSILLGALTLIITSIMNKLLPQIAYMEFQKLASGSYSQERYMMDFIFADTIAVILIAGGFVFGMYCFKSEMRSK